MNYNPRMGFNEQDYHLLKTHQSSGGSSEVIKLNDTKVYFDDQYNYNFDINCVAFIPGDFNIIGSNGCSITKIGTANPTNISDVSRMTITIGTDTDNGTRGQIEWGGVKWNITCGTGSSWFITLPQNYGYIAIKTVMGKAWEIL